MTAPEPTPQSVPERILVLSESLARLRVTQAHELRSYAGRRRAFADDPDGLVMTNALVTWLRAQLDADEAAATQSDPASWLPVGISPSSRIAAAYDPRRVIGMHRAALDAWRDPDANDVRDQDAYDAASKADWTVRVIAATAYSDRPGYREEWAPEA